MSQKTTFDVGIAVEEIKTAKQLVEKIPDFRVPGWFIEKITAAASLLRKGKVMTAAEEIKNSLWSFRNAVSKFLADGPQFFEEKVDQLEADMKLDEDLRNRINNHLEALRLAITKEQGLESFDQRIQSHAAAYKVIRYEVPEEQGKRDKRRDEKAREETRLQREAESERQRELARQRNNQMADDLIAALQ